MRLLHAKTLEFADFIGDDVPPYLILSHTWTDEEVSYQEMRVLQKRKSLSEELQSNQQFMLAFEAAALLALPDNRNLEKLKGYEKILRTAKIAQERGFDYFWIDTCCIDKSSSAELQEAINSMYNWYKRSEMCVVYLEDTHPAPYDKYWDLRTDTPVKHPNFPMERTSFLMTRFASDLVKSKWITRGWTLQELIAPRKLCFYSRNWTYIVDKSKASPAISAVTRIPVDVLLTGGLREASVAQKMSWAARRTTTRVEDRAYCLLGIFEVHMPMLYGEGHNAFLRLQKEIIRTTADYSIFAWTLPGVENPASIYRGLLAREPEEFLSLGDVPILPGSGVTESSEGLRLTLNMAPIRLGTGEVFHVVIFQPKFEGAIPLVLRELYRQGHVFVFLKQLEEVPHVRQKRYARVMDIPRMDSLEDYGLHFQSDTACVPQVPDISSAFCTSAFHCFYLQEYASLEWPRGHDFFSHEIIIPPENERFLAILKCRDRGVEENCQYTYSYVTLGFDRNLGPSGSPNYWSDVKSADHYAWPASDAADDEWEAAISRYCPPTVRSSRGEGDMEGFDEYIDTEDLPIVSIKPGIHDDRIVLFVNIQC